MTEEAKKKISISLKRYITEHGHWSKGKSSWNKGKKWSKEVKDKISTSRKGKDLRNTHGFKKGQVAWNYKGGRKSDEHLKLRRFLERRRRIRKIGNGGNHTKAEWDKLKKRYNYICLICHKSEPEIKLTEDHIIPLVKGGSDNIENIQPLCLKCNLRKGVKLQVPITALKGQ